MNSSMWRAVAFAAIGGVAALAPFAAQAGPCTDRIGFDTTTSTVLLDAEGHQVGAWGAVTAAGGDFKVTAKNTVANCEVKVVGTSDKKAPPKSVFLAGPMTQDQCSLYNYLSSIDSKMTAGKTGEAQTVAAALVSKIDNLGATGKLSDPGYTDVSAGAHDVQACTLGF
jgi:hypothetical protein